MRLIVSFLILVSCAFSQGTALSTNTWVKAQPSGYPASIVGYDKAVYDSANGRMLVWGAYHHAYSEQNTCLVGYSYSENRWDILDCNGMYHSEHLGPAGHSSGLFTLDTGRGVVQMLTDNSGSNMAEVPIHLYEYDTTGRNGRDKFTGTSSNAKPISGITTSLSSMVYDAFNGKTVLYPNSLGRTSVYDPTTNLWTDLGTLSNQPPTGLFSFAMVYNSTDHKIYVFGGGTGGSGCSLTFNRNVYTFNAATNTWAQLTVTGTPPSNRIYAGAAYSTADNIFLLAGGSVCTDGSSPLTDTWKFDPSSLAWTQLSPSGSYTGVPVEKLAYDPVSNAFVLMAPGNGTTDYAGGAWSVLPTAVYLFAYSTPLNYGRSSNSYTVHPGYLNRNTSSNSSQSIAMDVALAVNGTTISAGWVETSSPFSTVGSAPHPYVKSTPNTGVWSNLGSDYLAVDSDASGNNLASKTRLAYVNGVLWLTEEKSNNSGSMPSRLYAKQWSGSTWSGGTIGVRGTNAYQGISRILAAGTVPTVAFLEWTKDANACLNNAHQAFAYVDKWNGSAWVTQGAALNRTASCSRAEAIDATSDGTNTIACWVEHTINGSTVVVTNPQVFCSSVAPGGTITALGSVINNTSTNWAMDVAVAYMSGQPYVAWTERTIAGNPQLRVKTWNGSAWSAVGSVLNKNTSTGWPVAPRMSVSGSTLYLAWQEQQALGQPNRVYVSTWNGSSWSDLGGAANVDSVNGAVSSMDMAVVSGSPVVLFTESALGSLKQAYTRKWNGLGWVALSGATEVGKGCTTAYYIDADCDGYGTGARADGSYQIGENGNVLGNPLIATWGDLPDADDQDAAVKTTAEWRAAWGTTNAAMVSFLATRKSFTNTSRIWYLSQTGNNSTAVMNDPTHPYASASPILSAIFASNTGGAIIVRGGDWGTALDFRPCAADNPCVAATGATGSPLLIMAYPGERVVSRTPITNSTLYWPLKELSNVTYDGLTIVATTYGLGDGISLEDADHITVQNCEIIGWHQTWFGNHSENITVRNNVFHDSYLHAIYFGWSGLTGQTAGADFDFDADAVNYTNGSSIGAGHDFVIQGNVWYNNGSGGYEPIHVNTFGRYVTIDGNIVSYSGGTGIGIQTGIYDSTISNNVIFDNGACAITYFLYSTITATIRRSTVENNTIWVGNQSDTIRSSHPACGIVALDSTGIGAIKDITVRNNVIATYNNGFGVPFALSTNSYPLTWTINNNVFWSNDGTPQPATDAVMQIYAGAYPGNTDAGLYNLSQTEAYVAGWTNNVFSDPVFTAASASWTTAPHLYNFAIGAGSGAIDHSTTTTATTDVRGVSRGTPTDAGAYESGLSAGCSLGSTLPSATTGNAYAGALLASGCSSSSYTQSGLATGACSGLSLNSSTGAITGTPTTAGTCSFTGSYDTVINQSFSVIVNAASGSNGGSKGGGNTKAGGKIKR